MKYDCEDLRPPRHPRSRPSTTPMLMSYAMHAGLHNHGMDELSDRYLGHQPIPIK